MSKKLLIAVLTFGLIFAFSGAVIGSDDIGTRDTRLVPKDRVEITFEGDQSISVDMSKTPALLEYQAKEPVGTPGKYFPPEYFCPTIDHSNGVTTAGGWWDLPIDLSGYGMSVPCTLYATDYQVDAEGYTCTLKTVSVGIDPTHPYWVGTPDLLVAVGDGGRNPLSRITVPYASLPTTAGYVTVDFSTANGGGPFIYNHGDQFSIILEAPSLSLANVIIITSDDGDWTGSTTGGLAMLWWDAGWLNPVCAGAYCWVGYGDDGYKLNIAVELCCGDIPFTDCFTENYACPVVEWFLYTLPDWGTFGRNIQGQLIKHTGGADTLVYVEFGLYNTIGTPDLEAILVPTGSGGAPDTTTILWSDVIQYADLVSGFIAYNRFDVNYVMEPGQDYWIFFRADATTWADGDTLLFLTDDGLGDCIYGGRAYPLCGYSTPPGTCAWYGSNRNIAIKVNICLDEFDLCRYISRVDGECTPYYITPLSWWIPAYASSVDGIYKELNNTGLDCRIEFIRVALETRLAAAAYNVDVYVYEQDGPGGVPGTLLGHKEVLAADIIDYWVAGQYTVVDFSDLNIRTNIPIWIGVESQAPVSENDWDVGVKRDDNTCGNLYNTIQLWSDGWYGSGMSSFMDAYMCCIKPPERECGPPDDWAQGAHDSRRTGASNNSTAGAKDAQDLLWHDVQDNLLYPGTFMGTHGRPIIYDTVGLVPYGDRLVAYGLNGDGMGGPNRMWEITGFPYIGIEDFMNSVLAKDGKVYFGGSSERSFHCADIYTGAILWTRNITLNPLGLSGNTDYTIPVLLDIEGTEVIYLTSHAGELVALDAATGAFYPGWSVANPVQLDGDPASTMSSNGVDILYLGTNGSGGDLYGTLYAIDAATGATLWTVEEEDLMGHELDGDTLGYITTEIFQGPIAVDDYGELYVMTAFASEMYSNPSGGYYKISADGDIVWGVAGKFPRYTGVIIDASQAIFTSLVAWTTETESVDALDIYSGSTIWSTDTVLFKTINWLEGAMDCRPLAPDMIYQPNMDSRFLVINSEDGTIEFEYTYYDTLSDRGAGTAIGPDHVIMTNRGGDAFCFTIDPSKGDRPRLRILKYDAFEPVEPTTTQVTHADIFINNGAAPLTGSFVITDDEDADDVLDTRPMAVDPNRLNRLSSMADDMVNTTYESMTHLLHAQPAGVNVIEEGNFSSARSSSSVAAYAPPIWLTNLVTPSFTIGPDETFDLIYDVNASLVPRGPHRAFVHVILTNETYFLNSPLRDPIVNWGVIGGCLEVVDVCHFGDAGDNFGPVFNHSNIGTQQDPWRIDANGDAYWQGGLIFGASKYRLAMNMESWHGADANDFWNSMLPDANLYGTCPPEQTDMVLGRIWNDATSMYDDVDGHVFHYAYIDSVIDFGCDEEGWDWGDVHCGYDNDMTMGLKVYEWYYGAEHAVLGNFIIRKLKVTNRNATPLTEIGIGSMNDYDMQANTFDVFRFNEEYAIGYGQSCNLDVATWVWGQGTIPYSAPGTQKLYNVHTIDANQGGWHADYIFLDSIYYWMRNFSGATHQTGIDVAIPCDLNTASDDREVWMGMDFRDYDGYGEGTMGFYFFGFNDKHVDVDAQFFADFAVLVNQWAGFGRGDIDRDNQISLSDLVALFNLRHAGGDGPLFEHLADVDDNGVVEDADLVYMVEYWFGAGPAPVGAWVLPETGPIP